MSRPLIDKVLMSCLDHGIIVVELGTRSSIFGRQTMSNQALEELKRTDLITVNFHDLVALLRKAFDQVTIAGQLLDSQIFCRARTGPRRFGHRGEISYKLGSDLGRCNIAGQSIFYAANSPVPLPLEIDAKPGEVLTVGYWRSTRKLLLSQFGFSDEIRARLGTQLPTTAKGNWSSIEQIDSQLAQCYAYFMEAFTEVVSEDRQHHYKLTAAFAEILLGEIQEGWAEQFFPGEGLQMNSFDGIMFPSIAGRGNFHNFALKPMIIDAHAELFRVEAYQVETRSQFSCQVKPQCTGFLEHDGTISWLDEFETEFEVKLGDGIGRARHTDMGFRVFDKLGKATVGF